ncbi:pentatricopeptide repeat-containing protein At3g62890-like [Amborella trichopoda]|uniref:pentatricopeptide repeat-containing protein At3g62890-like n=1 Tax=Amborella trichopoda TaxID=13333 RepID=UPI0005D39791|nr:pentatricopeptide repeat-containing protein At3g62890-like [Amborella trichopoda]|eukprot:XP_011626696.1 pentatricopeptide repeat-containing protein At3g62890-like [Amborella trichopoda]
MHRQGTMPDSFTSLHAIKACTSLSLVPVGRQIHAHLLTLGLHTHVYVATCLLHLYGASNLFQEALRLFDELPHKNTVTWNTMISACAKSHAPHQARALFDLMPHKNLVSWSAVISAYTQSGHPKQAVRLFREMQLSGLKPDEVSMVNVLTACTHLGALALGRWVHALSRRIGFDPPIVALGTALVDMYAKCGCLSSALQVFERMPRRNVLTWSAMICGQAMHGLGKEALDLFEKMKAMTCLIPNEITFTGVLSACSHAGLVNEGLSHFRSMEEEYCLKPWIQHYGCMVDLLGRAGLLEEAYELVKTMRISPNVIVWGALLAACKTHRNVKLGERVIDHILESKPSHEAMYPLISNIYASAGKWEEAKRVRDLMADGNIKKMPGCSLLEVDNVVHEFVVGEKLHPQIEEIKSMLDEMHKEVRRSGHKPDTSQVLYDIDEEEKEHAVGLHSEKLAIAFGLLSLSPMIPIRIVKNLRMCGDCHVFIKLISEAYNHEIIVRDRRRFHHFKQGSCSCQDYW